MELTKFYQINTNNVVYVVTGAKTKAQALKFVSQYKKEKLANILFRFNVVKGKILNEELYVGSADALSDMDGEDCLAVYRKSIKL